MQQPLSYQPSLRTILLVVVVALAVLLAALNGGLRRPAARPTAPSPATIQAPSALNDTVRLEGAEDGPKQCVGPHEIEGPLC